MIGGLTWLGIRTAAKTFLGRYWEILLVMAALGFAVWYLDHRGFERAKTEDAAHQLEQQALTAAVVRSIDGDLGGKLEAIASSSSSKIQTIDTEGKTVVQPIITRELVRDPGLAAPGSCLTPSLLDAVNAARGFGTEGTDDAGTVLGSGNPAPMPAAPSGH